QSLGAIIVSEFNKSRFPHVSPPGFEIVKDPVAPVMPAFLIVAVRVRAEENAARFQGRVQFQEHARQLLAGDMKERGVGKDAVEAAGREFEREKVLLPHFATLSARHCGETRGAFQAY